MTHRNAVPGRGPRLRRHHREPNSILITEFLTFSSVAPSSKLLLSVNTPPPVSAHTLPSKNPYLTRLFFAMLGEFLPMHVQVNIVLFKTLPICLRALWPLGPQLFEICVCSYPLLYQFKICLQAKAGVIRVDPTCSISEITLGTDYGSLLGYSCFLCVSSFLADNSRKPSSISKFFHSQVFGLTFSLNQ